MPIHHALDLHRVHDATLTTVTFRTPKLDEGKSKQKADTGIQHFIGIDPASQRLVSYCAAVDVEEDLALRLSTLRRCACALPRARALALTRRSPQIPLDQAAH